MVRSRAYDFACVQEHGHGVDASSLAHQCTHVDKYTIIQLHSIFIHGRECFFFNKWTSLYNGMSEEDRAERASDAEAVLGPSMANAIAVQFVGIPIRAWRLISCQGEICIVLEDRF